MLLRIRLIVLLLVVLIAASCNMAQQSSVALPPEQISTPPPNVTCQELVTLAETTVGLVCDAIGRNQACYGNTLVSVDFQPDSNLIFSQSGDTVDLLAVRRIITGPLNMKTHEWGIAVIKAQANLPDALPGQNVTFLLFGDTAIDNPTPDMRAVTVSTGIGTLECDEVPNSGVLIQSPEGSQVVMNINGADVTLASTAFITTNSETERMTFNVLEGTGVISAFDTVQVVTAGAKTGIPLGGGPDGLQAAGPPSDPSPFDITTLQNLPLNLLDRPITMPPPIDPSQLIPDAPTATPTALVACTPRTDWTARYVIQVGDNLSAIALRLNMRTADLQAGNCIADPNRLIAGQSIRVPRPVATNTPLPTATFTPSATPAAMIGPNLRADENPIIYPDTCTFVRWDVDNIQSVYFEGQPVIGHDAREVCPTQETTYTLLVILLDGSRKTFPITIQVQTYSIDRGG